MSKDLSKWKKKAIDEAKRIARSKGRCEKCGRLATEWQMHGSHILPVRYAGTAADPENILCLCASCHKMSPSSWHESPLENAEWFRQKWPGRFEELTVKAYGVARYRAADWKEIYEKLKKSTE